MQNLTSAGAVPHDSRAILGLVLLTSFSGLGVGIARIATSLYSIELQANAMELGLIAAAQSIGILFMSIPVGMLIHSIGPRPLFTLGSILCGVVYIVLPLVPHVSFIILCTVLASFLLPMRFIPLNAVFMAQLENLGAAQTGWFRGLHMTGFFLLAPLVAANLVAWGGYTQTFILVAGSFFLAIFLAPLVMPPHELAGGVTSSLTWRSVCGQLVLLVRHAALRRAALIECLAAGVTAYFGFFIVVIAIRDYGFSEALAASLVTVQGGAFVLALFLTGTFITRWGQRRFYYCSYGVIVPSLLLLAWQGPSQWLWVGAATLGLGLGMLHIVNFTLFGRIGEELGAGRVSGLAALAGPSGGLMGGIAGGWLGELWGFQMLFAPMAVLLFLLILDVRNLPAFDRRRPLPVNVLPEIESEL